MAQSVERVLGKDEVGGSNPPSSSKRTFHSESSFCFSPTSYSIILDEVGVTLAMLAIPSLRSLQIRLVAPKELSTRKVLFVVYEIPRSGISYTTKSRPASIAGRRLYLF